MAQILACLWFHSRWEKCVYKDWSPHVGKRLQNSGHFLVFTVYEQGGLGFFSKCFKKSHMIEKDCHDYHRYKRKKVVRVGESLYVVLSMILVFWRWILIGWICRITASKHRRTRLGVSGGLGVPRGLAVPRGRGSVAVTSWRGCTWEKKYEDVFKWTFVCTH